MGTTNARVMNRYFKKGICADVATTFIVYTVRDVLRNLLFVSYCRGVND